MELLLIALAKPLFTFGFLAGFTTFRASAQIEEVQAAQRAEVLPPEPEPRVDPAPAPDPKPDDKEP